MLVKRIILVVISLAVGAGVTVAVTLLIGTTPTEYGLIYFLFSSLFIGIALGIWLDKFMQTELIAK